MTKQIVGTMLIVLAVALLYLFVFTLAVKYVWPDIKHQVIEILQEGRK
jgi:hypothetical protein